MVRLPHDWENIQRSQLNPLLSSLPLSSLDTLSFPLAHTHTYRQTCSAYSVSPSLFQCSVKRVILSSFTYLREEFPALVMIRHRSSLIKWRKSSPKLTKEEILTECSFCKKPAGFRGKAIVSVALKDTTSPWWLKANSHWSFAVIMFMYKLYYFEMPDPKKVQYVQCLQSVLYSTSCPTVKYHHRSVTMPILSNFWLDFRHSFSSNTDNSDIMI